MLYDSVSIITYGFCIAFVSPRAVDGATTTITASSGQYSCSGTSDDHCIISCDMLEEKLSPRNFDCGNVGDCQFECDENKCIGIGGSVNAANAQNLHVSANAMDCLHGATVYTPDNGNATFAINGILNGFHQMTVEGGANAQSIIIECYSTKEEKEDCKGMAVDAQNANHLSITIQSANWDTGTVICPSADTNSNAIPCVLTVGSSGTLSNVQITAPGGIPANVWIEDQGGTIDYATITIYCDDGQSVGPFSASSTCWNALTPTIYSSTTPNPALNPSQITPQPTTTTTAQNAKTAQPSTTISTPTTSTVAKFTTSPTIAGHNPLNPTVSSVVLYPTPSPIDNVIAPTSEAIHSAEANKLDLALVAIITLSVMIICCFCCIFFFCLIKNYRKLKNESSAVMEEEEISEESDVEINPTQRAAEQQAVLKWLRSIGSEEYFHQFIKAGFESIAHVQSIDNKNILKAIGVKKLGHQAFIFTEIQRLNTNFAQTNPVEGGGDAPHAHGLGSLNVPGGLPPLPRDKTLDEMEGELILNAIANHETIGFVQE